VNRVLAPLSLALVVVAIVAAVGCSSATGGATTTAMPATTVGSMTPSTAASTTTTEIATTTTEWATTTTTEATTTTTGVQVTNESGTSACLVKDVFTRDGSNYLVVDYVTTEPTPREDDENTQIIKNENPKLRTFVIPAGADLHAYAILIALFGESARPRPITVDELKQAVAKGIINSRAGYGFWYVTVSKGRVVTLTNDFG
jgi:hypothetical protein